LPYNQSYSLVYKRGFEIDVLGGWNIISFPVTLYGNRNTVNQHTFFPKKTEKSTTRNQKNIYTSYDLHLNQRLL